ncbi:MAG: hypothetical protein QM706_02735 [Nitrospira sp.]
MMRRVTNHAVVLGGSMAGLLAARVLSEHYERVSIVERDLLGANVEARRGVPQGRHIHGLLAGGLAALDALFPGFSASLIRRGAIPGDIGTITRSFIGGLRLLSAETGHSGLLMSRPLIEAHVRELVLNRRNITLLDRHSVLGLLGNEQAVSGAKIQSNESTDERDLSADLVVDATGRGSRVPTWLQSFGLPTLQEELVEVDITYTTCTVRCRPECLKGEQGIIVNPSPPYRRAGAVLAQEDDHFIITLTGYLGDVGPTDYAGMTEFAKGLPVPDLYEFMISAEPLSDVMQMRFKASQRRRYEKLTRFPEGLIVMGDALCSFNPAYGQGMSVAALEARLLDRCLSKGTPPLFRKFFTEAARLIDVPWSIVVGGDLGFEEVQGLRSSSTWLTNKFQSRLIRAATRNLEVVKAFTKVMHMVEPQRTFFSPRILSSVLLYGGR